MNLNLLVKKFADSVMLQSEAMKRADAETGNKHARAYIAAFEALRSHGDAGREALTSLFEHENSDVRISAAAYLLRYCEDKARAVLEAEARGKGFQAFTAAQALERWEDGEWDLDPK
jgi:hypothetical protein